MNSQSPSQVIWNDPQFQKLMKRRNQLALLLFLLIFSAYGGYMALLAFAPQVLAPRWGATSIGIPLGAGVIVFAWILTGIYVRWANNEYDTTIARLKAQSQTSREL